MRFRIEHRTRYHYLRPVASTRQLLRLSPRSDRHQRVLNWRIRAPGRLSALADAYGNASHLHLVSGEHRSVQIEAAGEVEIDALDDGRLDERDGLPPAAFLAGTALTEADEPLREFAARYLKGSAGADLLDFALAVGAAIAYRPGATRVHTRAAEAYAQREGVCQDHAHVFIAGCRAAGIPARYVSGYYHRPGHVGDAASHAWADAWVAGKGWVSIDITHGCFASDALCRLAIGRDYDSASPVRGVRVGGGEETMETQVVIEAIEPGAPGSLERRDEVTA